MRFLLPPLLAFFLVGPRLPAFGGLGDTISLVSAAAVAALAIRALMAPVWLPATLRPFIGTLLLLIAYSGTVSLLNGHETFYFERSLRVALNFLGGVSLGLAALATWRDDAPQQVLRIVYWVVSAHGLLIVMQFLSPPFREMVYAWTVPSIDPVNINFRMAGLTGGAGSGTSLVQFLAMLVLPVVWTWSTSIVTRTVIILSVLVNLASFFVTGRTGLAFALVFTPLVAIAWRWIRRHTSMTNAGTVRAPTWWRTLLAGLGAVLVLSVLSGVAIKVVADRNLGLDLATAADRTLRTVFEYRDTGRLSDDTVADLYQRHLIVPADLTTFVFGNGSTSRERVDSDIGYVQYLFALGVVGSAIVVWFYFLVVRSAWRARFSDPALALLSIALAVALLGAHAKEPFLFSRYYFSVTTLMLVLLLARPLLPSLALGGVATGRLATGDLASPPSADPPRPAHD